MKYLLVALLYVLITIIIRFMRAGSAELSSLTETRRSEWRQSGCRDRIDEKKIADTPRRVSLYEIRTVRIDVRSYEWGGDVPNADTAIICYVGTYVFTYS